MSRPAPHRARKRFGQNFLRDGNTIERILQCIRPRPDEPILEIGPGQGALTDGLLAAGARVTAVEVDRDLATDLRARYGNRTHFHLIEADVLTVALGDLPGGGPWRVVGNLPYNIATPLLFHCLAELHRIRDMHVMLQKEMAERLAARPGTRHWGRLGVMVQYQCTVESLLTVPPEAFRPRPRVQSAIVRLRPRATPGPIPPEQLLPVVTRAFQQRRKTLRNALSGIMDSDALSRLGIAPERRPDTLSLDEFVTIAQTMPSAPPRHE